MYEYEHRERVGGEPFTTLHKTYICELPRLANKAPAEMGPVESWFYLLKNICNFAKKPEGINSRYDSIIEAAKTNLVPDKERTQYLRAMLSDYDKQDIGQAYYELGREEEREIWLKKEDEWKQRLRKTVKRMLEKGNGVTSISEYLGLTPEEVDALATPSND